MKAVYEILKRGPLYSKILYTSLLPGVLIVGDPALSGEVVVCADKLIKVSPSIYEVVSAWEFTHSDKQNIGLTILMYFFGGAQLTENYEDFIINFEYITECNVFFNIFCELGGRVVLDGMHVNGLYDIKRLVTLEYGDDLVDVEFMESLIAINQNKKKTFVFDAFMEMLQKFPLEVATNILVFCQSQLTPSRRAVFLEHISLFKDFIRGNLDIQVLDRADFTHTNYNFVFSIGRKDLFFGIQHNADYPLGQLVLVSKLPYYARQRLQKCRFLADHTIYGVLTASFEIFFFAVCGLPWVTGFKMLKENGLPVMYVDPIRETHSHGMGVEIYLSNFNSILYVRK